MAKNQAPNATAQGEVLLAKYLTDSIRSIEQCIRKAATHGVSLATLPRSLSATRLDTRGEGRRPSTEILLPRNFPAAYAPVAAAAAAAAVAAAASAATAKVAANRPAAAGGQVAAMQSRLLQPGPSLYGSTTVQHRPSGVTAGTSMQPMMPKTSAGTSGRASPLPPRPAVVRTGHAAQQQQQHQPYQHHQQQQKTQPQQQQYAATNSASGGGALQSHQGRAASAPRIDVAYGPGRAQPSPPSPSPRPHGPPLARGGLARLSSSSGLSPPQQPQPHQRHVRSEARVPAVAAAPPLVGLLGAGGGGGAGPQGDARSTASFRRSAPSDAGSHASWWRWRPVTDASYPLTAVTDRYAQSMTPSELVRWNDRVTRLEAEITAEKERRRQFEEQLKKLKVVTKSEPQAPGAAGAGGRQGKGVSHPFR